MRSSASDWSDISIQNPYWAAFKHTTGFFVGGEDDNGEAEIYHTWNDGYSKFKVRELEILLTFPSGSSLRRR